MVAVERTAHYSDMAPERTRGPSLVPANWPSQGKVEFRDVTLQYNATAQPALRNVSFTIAPGDKIGVIGRTGAGKSSLFSVGLCVRSASLFACSRADCSITQLLDCSIAQLSQQSPPPSVVNAYMRIQSTKMSTYSFSASGKMLRRNYMAPKA